MWNHPCECDYRLIRYAFYLVSNSHFFQEEAERIKVDTKEEIGKYKSLTRKINSPRFYYSQKLSISAVKMDIIERGK